MQFLDSDVSRRLLLLSSRPNRPMLLLEMLNFLMPMSWVYDFSRTIEPVLDSVQLDHNHSRVDSVEQQEPFNCLHSGSRKRRYGRHSVMCLDAQSTQGGASALRKESVTDSDIFYSSIYRRYSLHYFKYFKNRL